MRHLIAFIPIFFEPSNFQFPGESRRISLEFVIPRSRDNCEILQRQFPNFQIYRRLFGDLFRTNVVLNKFSKVIRFPVGKSIFRLIRERVSRLEITKLRVTELPLPFRSKLPQLRENETGRSVEFLALINN